LNISIIGAGKVGKALAIKFKSAGHQIHQVFSRKLDHAKALAELTDSEPTNDIHSIKNNADIYFLAVKDDAILELATSLNINQKIIVHCSGATALSIFEGIHKNYGVFYPLQTFSPDIEPDFSELPICIAANNFETEEILTKLAKTICPNIYQINEGQRKNLHIAAVFANNFSNYLYTIAEDICIRSEIDFKILLPLIKQTVRKIESSKPSEVQTGPAIREDHGTIQKHLESLKKEAPEYLDLYQLMTNMIIQSKNK
jgi:predicted short-subunit dehydrogenase-like oxidoreductase (DUF2520 family)